MRSHPLRLVFFGLLLASCGEGVSPFRGEGGALQSVPTSTCVSGQQWQGGTEGSSVMAPGQDCIACHDSGEGPHYTAAGTVFQQVSQANDCTGVSGVTVEITGADGGVTTLTTNSVGNFYTRQFIEMPYSVKLISGTNTRIMAGHQTTGACNSCHTATGLNGAPGRILAP